VRTVRICTVKEILYAPPILVYIIQTNSCTFSIGNSQLPVITKLAIANRRLDIA
jgi:hypothetical protein